MYNDEYSVVWASHGGKKPLAEPLCGFENNKCPVNVFAVYGVYIILGSLAILLIFTSTIAFFIM